MSKQLLDRSRRQPVAGYSKDDILQTVKIAQIAAGIGEIYHIIDLSH